MITVFILLHYCDKEQKESLCGGGYTTGTMYSNVVPASKVALLKHGFHFKSEATKKKRKLIIRKLFKLIIRELTYHMQEKYVETLLNKSRSITPSQIFARHYISIIIHTMFPLMCDRFIKLMIDGTCMMCKAENVA